LLPRGRVTQQGRRKDEN